MFATWTPVKHLIASIILFYFVNWLTVVFLAILYVCYGIGIVAIKPECSTWAHVLTNPFSICNGVRQGGILSPFLFAMYIDDLSVRLQSVHVGCRLSNIIINHFLFADDVVIFSPSAKGLQELLNVCTSFAQSHNVVFNTTKSQCMIINSKYKVLRNPSFRLCSTCLPYTDKYKYLGHVICADLTDDADVMKLTRSLYARANSIIRKFTQASLTSKIVLFKAYCTPMYVCQLWSSVFQYSLNKLKVAYNDGFRLLLNEPRWRSASRLTTWTFPYLTLFFSNWFMFYVTL